MKILWFLFLNLQVRWMMCLGSCPFSWFWHFLFPKKKKSEKWEKEKWRGGRGSKASRKIRTGRLEEMRKRSDLSSDCRQSCFRDFFFPHRRRLKTPRRYRHVTVTLSHNALVDEETQISAEEDSPVVWESARFQFDSSPFSDFRLIFYLFEWYVLDIKWVNSKMSKRHIVQFGEWPRYHRLWGSLFIDLLIR